MAKKRKLKKKMPIIIFSVLLVALFVVGYQVAANYLFPDLDTNLLGQEKDVDESILNDRINVLLLGMDARPGETKSRTDTMIFVSVDKETNRISMMSIPRDTRVEIPKHGYQKINSANVFGGPELASQVVSDLLGVPIDYYVLTNFNGFKDIVDAVGGLDYEVEQNMSYYDPMDGTRINLKKGMQHLDGDKALQYVRFRGYVNGDVDRAAHQQKFLKALAQEVLSPSSVTKLHKIVPSVSKNVETNLGVMEMASLAKAAKNLSNLEIVTQTLPGTFATIDGLSYWHVEPEVANQAVMALFEGETTETIQGSTVVQNTVTETPKTPETPTKKEQATDWVPTQKEPVTDTSTEPQNSGTDNSSQQQGQGEQPSDGDVDESTNATPQQQTQPPTNDASANNGTPWLPPAGGYGQTESIQIDEQ
ncbi:LCP family protein [Peptococcaceae bacterium 1198_IL3148]